MKQTQSVLASIGLVALFLACEGRPSVVRISKMSESRASLAPVEEQVHSATVRTNGGTFRRPVRIAGDMIQCIEWTKDHCSPFFGQSLLKGEASGTTQQGQVVSIEIDRLSNEG